MGSVVRSRVRTVSIEIKQHSPGKDTSEFIRAGYAVFGDDPHWIPPLETMLRERLDPAKDPFHRHAEVALFTAWKNGELVGRISATIDHSWLATWRDETGHFGYFDTRDDLETARALVGAAEAWLRERGMRRMNGPMSLSANHDVGILIDGFEHPPVVDMGHSRAWQAGLAEACGLTKEKDVYGWRYDVENGFNQRTEAAWQKLAEHPEITLRSVELRKMRQELGTLMDIYNETWSGKWGYVPLESDELDKIAGDLKLIVDPELAFIAEIDGASAGMCIAVPNLNEAIADLNGKLLPLGWVKLLWRAKIKHPRSARVILLGVRDTVRKNVKKYGFLSAAMYVEVAKRGAAKGYEWAEMSWTREDDAPINLGIRSMGGIAYKTYRVYEKPL